MPDMIFIYVSCPDMEVAGQIGRALVDSRHAVAANMLPGMQSVYRWGGEVVEGAEAMLLIRTTANRFEDIRVIVRRMHPYQMPSIVAVPIVDGDPGYLEWVTVGSTPTMTA